MMVIQKLYGILIILLFMSFTSCKTYQKVDWIKPPLPKEERSILFESRQLSRLKEGDKIYIKTKDSLSYDIVYSMVQNDSIKGQFLQKNNRRIKVPIDTGIPLSQVHMLKVKKSNLLASIGVGVIVPVSIWVYFLIFY
ncbi:hypothetical protein AAGF08_16145 [Algoriphagus sp. SE2]|uniref:hypothetical protein n=1 Tax=Algoriphagus sp. SE2 TaxID=3141536 RepID=UPI0031CD3AB2